VEPEDTQSTPYYSEVYDGSSQYSSSGQIGSPILASPSAEEKNSSSEMRFVYPPLSSPPLPYRQQHQRHHHQKNHSIGFDHEKNDGKTSGDADRHSFLEGFGGQHISNSNAKPVGILDRLGLRSDSAKDDPALNAGLPSVDAIGTKKIQRKIRK
jgi:hypothetical protein